MAVRNPDCLHDRAVRESGIGRSDSPRTLVVLGEPAFYERCTFSRSRAARLRSAYPLSHLMIARPGDDIPEETLIYPEAFEGV